MLKSLLTYSQRLCDSAHEWRPVPPLTPQQASALQIVGHRGAFGPGLKENRLESFKSARDGGVWGIEFDVRWSKDFVPFVHHDETLHHSLQKFSRKLSELEWHNIHAMDTGLPRLDEVIRLCGKRCHLMIEVKEPLFGEKEERFIEALEGLEPVSDFHLLTLRPELLAQSRLPRSCYVFVSELNFMQGSRFVLDNQWGGLAGHYLLLNERIRQKHHAKGQKIGVGFVNGLNNLYRQARLQADWIFSDRAVTLQQQLGGP